MQTILQNADLLCGAGGIQKGVDILIGDGYIRGLAPTDAAAAPPGSHVMNVGGRVVMPGLVVGHCHLEYDKTGSALGVLQWGAERPHGVAMAYAIKNAARVLRGGVTSAIMAACAYDIDAELEIAIAEGVAFGPSLRPCSPHLNAVGATMFPSPWWLGIANTGLEAEVSGPDEFRRAVRTFISRGARTIKMMGGNPGFHERTHRTYSRDELDAVVAAAHERGAIVRCHLSYREQILEAIEAGVDIIDHADELDDDCIAAFAESGVALAGTPLRTLSHVAQGRRPRSAYDDVVAQLAKAHEAGVTMLVGDDYGYVGREDHRPGRIGAELVAWVDDVGLDPLAVIKMATFNGAQVGGFDAGSIEVGKRADLLIVDANPLDDISVLARPLETVVVMKGGVIYDGSPQWQDDSG
jgi:imidazolonepropionase-like amidohydrolase